MIKSRKKKATINIISATIYELIAFISGLILPRLILSNFGSEYNGITSSIVQFLNLVAILRLGIAGATRVALYKTLANDDLEGTSSIVKATENYMRKIGIVIIIYICVLAFLYPLIIHSSISYFDVVILIIASGIGTFAQYYFGITYQTFLSADQSIYIYNFIQVGCTLLNTIISVILIKLGFSIQFVKGASALIFFATPLILNIYVSKKYKLKKDCEPNKTALDGKKDVMGHSIANIIHSNTDIIVLSVFCNVKVVSIYTVYNLVMTGLKKVLDIFSTGTESIFGNMVAKNENDKIKKNLNLYEYIIGIFIIVSISCTLVLLIPFVSLYTKGIKDVNYILPSYAIVITIAQAFFCMRTPYLTLVQGAGHYKETKKGAYLEAILNLSISVVLVNIIGIVGTAIGTLFANIFRTLQYAIYIEKNIISRGKNIIINRFVWITLSISIISFFGKIFLYKYAIISWISWTIIAIMMIIISAFITLITSLLICRDDLFQLYLLVKSVVKKGE